MGFWSCFCWRRWRWQYSCPTDRKPLRAARPSLILTRTEHMSCLSAPFRTTLKTNSQRKSGRFLFPWTKVPVCLPCLAFFKTVSWPILIVSSPRWNAARWKRFPTRTAHWRLRSHAMTRCSLLPLWKQMCFLPEQAEQMSLFGR